MDSKSWINAPSFFPPPSSSSSSLKRCQSRSGDVEKEDDLKTEYICPFCAEEFDIVGLCCHIDEEHPVEAKNGINHYSQPFESYLPYFSIHQLASTLVCPVCTKKVGWDIVGHITTQHAKFFKVQQRRRLTSGDLALKKRLREANIKSLLGGSSRYTSPTNIDSDPLLSSFVFNSPSANQYATKSATPVAGQTSAIKVSEKDSLKREIPKAPLSGEDQEKAKIKSEFVRGLLLSTMFADEL